MRLKARRWWTITVNEECNEEWAPSGDKNPIQGRPTRTHTVIKLIEIEPAGLYHSCVSAYDDSPVLSLTAFPPPGLHGPAQRERESGEAHAVAGEGQNKHDHGKVRVRVRTTRSRHVAHEPGAHRSC